MRRSDRALTDIYRIEHILQTARYLHLGLFDDEYPYVVPLHYGYVLENGTLTFYVHCAHEGHKLDCLRKNDRVFVEIDCAEALLAADVPCKYSAEYESVMCRGRAVFLRDAKKKCEALRILMKTQTGKPYAFTEEAAAAVTVIQINVDSYTAKAHIR